VKVVSVNVGLPRELEWSGKRVTTGIFKSAVSGPVSVHTLNLEGDGQADLSVHGGPAKAVYAYPSEHYDWWRTELPGVPLPWGAFGENLSTQGLMEDDVQIGDEFRIGTVMVRATEPRMPCYKLGVRFERSDIVRRFLQSGRSGFYFAVIQEGRLQEGDSIERAQPSDHNVTIADVARLYTTDRENVDLLRRVVALDALGESWRGYFLRQLEKMTSQSEGGPRP
jgi:MOSC domain-containing protein YiiM